MQNVKIENLKEFTGSVSWLKNEIENMRFRFSSRDGVPSVEYAFLHTNKETGEKTTGTWCTAVLMADSQEVKHKYYDVCDEYENTIITFPSSNDICEHQWAMFPYLTPNAQIHCNRLIHMLADELIKKVKADRGDLKIKVTCSHE